MDRDDEYSVLDFGWDKFNEIQTELNNKFPNNPNRDLEIQKTLLRCVVWDCVLDGAAEDDFLDYLTWLYRDCKERKCEFDIEDGLKYINENINASPKSKPTLRLVK